MAPDAARDVEAAVAALAIAGGGLPAYRRFLAEWGDERLMLALVRRRVPAGFLEYLGRSRPWCDDALLAGGIVRNPRTPRHVALGLVGNLFWRDLAEAAADPGLTGVVRVRAEALLRERLPDLRLGDRISLARLATPPVLRELLAESDLRVLEAALQNPRLTEEALLTALRASEAGRPLLEQAAASARWRERYAVRRALVMQPRTPLALALSFITGLSPGDLRGAAGTEGLPPLVRAAAARAADEGEGQG